MARFTNRATLLGSGLGVSIVAAALLFLAPPEMVSNAQVASAQQAISEAPIGPTKVLKIKSIDIKSQQAIEHDVDISVEPAREGLGIVFEVRNTGSQDKSLEVDGWQTSFSGAIFGIKPERFSAEDALAAGSSVVLRELDLEAHAELLAEYPGVYTASLRGYNDDDIYAYQEMVDAGQAPEKELQDLAAYSVTAEVVVGFDEEALKGNVIESHNTEISIAGDGDPFAVSKGNPMEVTVLLRNDNDHPVSGNLYAISTNVYSVEHTKAAGKDTIIETFEGFCKVMQPGETLKVKSMILDSGRWPLAGDSESALSQKLGSGEAAIPGKYVVEVDGTTAPCNKDGKLYEPISFGTMVVVEAK